MSVALNAKSEFLPQMTDVQSSADQRCLEIQRVGIKDLTYPIIFNDKHGLQQTRANCNLYVKLPADQRGTHMSRFIDLMNQYYQKMSIEKFNHLPREIARALDATSSRVELDFTFFRWKEAPVSGVNSAMDYNITLIGEYADKQTTITIKVAVPATSLCPCSKTISDFGAHNQRSLISITVKANQPIWIEDIIEIAEQNASSEVFGLVKREDEKYLTEFAYENPKFVEDIVRDVALNLQKDERISGFIVETENFESIHNHSAYAMIDQMY
jgi:GTP cyclohydrolase I